MCQEKNGDTQLPRPLISSSKTSRLVKPVGKLATLSTINKNPSILLGSIQKFLMERIDKPNGRRQDCLHPSAIAHSDWCPRQSNYQLAGALITNPVKAHGVELENIFDEGHQIHAKWQNRMWDMGRLWGRWYCIDCCHDWEATSPLTCPGCGATKEFIQYREVPIDGFDKYLIAGREDGAINDLNAIVEIKSLGQGSLRMEDPGLLREHQVVTTEGKKVYDLDGIWKGLKRPLPTHVRQTAIYLELARQMGHTYDKVIFIYEYKANQMVKEFMVKYNPNTAKPILDQALDIKFALSKGTIVPRPLFVDKEKKPCTTCPYLNLCWSDTNEPANKAPEDKSHQYLGPSRTLGSSSTEAAAGGSRPTRATGRDDPTSTSRRNRAGRQRTDDPVHSPNGVADLHGSEVGSSRGRREIRRRVS